MKSVLVALLAVTATCYAAPKQRARISPAELVPSTLVVDNDGYPSSLDWRTQGVISPVQNRPRNISGSALIVMETVQSLHAIQTGQMLNLSLPQVLDCFHNDLVVDSFDVLKYIGGLCLEMSYPERENKCDAGECPIAAPVVSSSRIFNLTQMEAAIQKRPLMVFVDGRHESFKSYSGGIYNDPLCNSNHFSIALQVVGYGTENEVDFWICKNNWGTHWGENGYIRIVKGYDRCNIERTGQYPI